MICHSTIISRSLIPHCSRSINTAEWMYLIWCKGILIIIFISTVSKGEHHTWPWKCVKKAKHEQNYILESFPIYIILKPCCHFIKISPGPPSKGRSVNTHRLINVSLIAIHILWRIDLKVVLAVYMSWRRSQFRTTSARIAYQSHHRICCVNIMFTSISCYRGNSPRGLTLLLPILPRGPSITLDPLNVANCARPRTDLGPAPAIAL